MFSARSKFKKYFLKTLGILVLFGTIYLMCVLHLWYTMFLTFGLGIVLSLITGKGSYCSTYCPLGTLQEQFHDDKKKRKKRKLARFIKPAYIILFWILVIFSTFSNRNNEVKLWVYMLRIMISQFMLALLLQEFLGKRFYCIHLCPLRIPILKHIIKFRRSLSKRRTKQTT